MSRKEMLKTQSPYSKTVAAFKGNAINAREAFAKALVEGMEPSKSAGLPRDEYFATRLVIRDKRGKTVPFVLNPPQWDFLANSTNRDIIVKARQMGFSTAIQGTHAEECDKREGVACLSISDSSDNTMHLRDIFTRFWQNLPPAEVPELKRRYPLGFYLPTKGSTIYIGTAGTRTWGRAKTVHLMHGSEVAYWPDAKTTLSGIMESIPFHDQDTHVHSVLESTANGRGGYFYDIVQASLRGLNPWKVHFYAWWWDRGYRLPVEPTDVIVLSEEEEALREYVYKTDNIELDEGHFKWRRDKIASLGNLFQQEYPESVTQAFLHSGYPRFDVQALESRLTTQCQEPIFTDLTIWNEGNKFDQVRVYERPIQNEQYVIGADTSEGIQVDDDSTDFSAAVVRQKSTNRQVASVQGRFEPYEFAYVLMELGKAYNHALLAVERNNHGHSVINFLLYGSGDGRIKPYPAVYEHFDDERPGWPTNVKTRAIMIDELALEYRNPYAYHINDAAIIDEAMSFVRDAAGKFQAIAGGFDDLVIADAIAGQARVRLHETVEVKYEPVRIGDF